MSHRGLQEPRIFGDEIFFNFIEIDYSEIAQKSQLVSQIKNKSLDGFITKGVFTDEELKNIKEALSSIPDTTLMPTPSGKVYPYPFATITDTGERLDSYYAKLHELNLYKEQKPAIQNLTDKLDSFFKTVAGDYNVSIPLNKIKDKEVAPGTFRIFMPNMGGLHVHCGNLFQEQSLFYYSLLKNDVDMDDQLSYFIVLQQAEEGGELTIYDMLWEHVVGKESPENNQFVIDKEGRHIFLDQVKSFSVKPQPGDILVFAGGPIWHRVEDIKGNEPRITFGGFLNFSNDNTELYYWS